MNPSTSSSILTWITFLPLLGAALMLPVLGMRAAGVLTKGAADQASRVIAFVASGLTLVLALYLWRVYDPTNPALQFERRKTRGFRLDIPAGTAVRFEPGESRRVRLVAYAGARIVQGFQGRVGGPLGG